MQLLFPLLLSLARFTLKRYSKSIFFVYNLPILMLPGIFFTSCQNQQTITINKQNADSITHLIKLQKANAQIDSIKSFIQNGDMITRTGADFTSESLRSLNQRDQTYSHCGIASIENDSLFVYHALGGDFNPDQKILRQPLAIFALPDENRGIGIFRFKINKIARNEVVATAKKLFASGTRFDMKFDLKTDDHMYCAEYVYKSLLWGSHGKLQFEYSHIKNFTFIGVDDLFLHPLCELMGKIVYK